MAEWGWGIENIPPALATDRYRKHDLLFSNTGQSTQNTTASSISSGLDKNQLRKCLPPDPSGNVRAFPPNSSGSCEWGRDVVGHGEEPLYKQNEMDVDELTDLFHALSLENTDSVKDGKGKNYQLRKCIPPDPSVNVKAFPPNSSGSCEWGRGRARKYIPPDPSRNVKAYRPNTQASLDWSTDMRLPSTEQWFSRTWFQDKQLQQTTNQKTQQIQNEIDINSLHTGHSSTFMQNLLQKNDVQTETQEAEAGPREQPTTRQLVPQSYKRLYKCDYCDKTFRKFCHLKQHRQSHICVAVVNSSYIENAHLNSVKDNNWLTSGVIDMYSCYLVKNAVDKGSKVTYINVKTMTDIIEQNLTLTADQEILPLLVLKYGEMILGVYLERQHFILVVIAQKNREVYIYDPVGADEHKKKKVVESWRKFILQISPSDTGLWKIASRDHSKQQDSYNCGIYCLMFVQRLLQGHPLTNITEEMLIQKRKDIQAFLEYNKGNQRIRFKKSKKKGKNRLKCSRRKRKRMKLHKGFVCILRSFCQSFHLSS